MLIKPKKNVEIGGGIDVCGKPLNTRFKIVLLFLSVFQL